MNKVILEEVSSPGCQVCRAFEEWWHAGPEKDFPNVELQKIDMTTPEGQEMISKHMIFASPGIIINGELFSTGGFNKNNLLEKLKSLSIS